MGIMATGLWRAAGQVLGSWGSETRATPQDAASESAGGAAPADELTLSAPAEAAQQGSLGELLAAELFPGVPRPANGSIRLDDLRQYYADQQESLESRIRSLLNDEGIDVPPEIRLQVGADGSVVVAGDHPDRQQIEELFRENPRLRNQFVEVASLGEQIRAVDETLAFQKAYAENPQAAVEAFSHLFSGKERPQYSLLIQANGSTAQFV